MLNPKLSKIIARAAPVLLLTPNSSWRSRLQELIADKPILTIHQWCAQQCLALNPSLRELPDYLSSSLWYALARSHNSSSYAQEAGWRALLADAEAWQTCTEHMLNLDNRNWQQSEASALFAQRARRYRDFLAENAILETRASASALQANLSPGVAADIARSTIVLAGFTHLPPASARLVQKLRQFKVRVNFCSQPLLAASSAERCRKLACASEPEQLQRALSQSATKRKIIAPQLSVNELVVRAHLPTAALGKLLNLATGAHAPADFYGALSNCQLCPPQEQLGLVRAEREIRAIARMAISLEEILAADYLGNSPDCAENIQRIQKLAQSPAQSLASWLPLIERAITSQLVAASARGTWEQVGAELRQLSWLEVALSFSELLCLLRLALYRQRPATVTALADYLGSGDNAWLLRAGSLGSLPSPRHSQIATNLSGAHPAVERRLIQQLRSSGADIVCSDTELALAALPFPRHEQVDIATPSRSFSPDPAGAALRPSEAPPRALNKIIAAQQTCPFQSFARHRLQLDQPPSEAELQPNAGLRGEALHQILEQLGRAYPNGWQAVTTERLQRAVRDNLHQFASQFPHCDPAWQGRESQRLMSLLRQLLEVEQQRAPYVIEQLEQTREFELLGFSFKLRIDRVDKLASGRLLVIDYKTGAYVSKAKAMAPDRFTDPQAGIYSLATGCDGAALLQVNPRNIDYFGWGADTTKPLDNSRSYQTINTAGWQNFLHEWRQQLELIFGAYIRGEAEVKPVSAQSCRLCNLQPLCRVQSLN